MSLLTTLVRHTHMLSNFLCCDHCGVCVYRNWRRNVKLGRAVTRQADRPYSKTSNVNSPVTTAAIFTDKL